MAQAGQEVAQPWGSSLALLRQHQPGAEGSVSSASHWELAALGQSPGSALCLIQPSPGGCGCSCLSLRGFWSVLAVTGPLCRTHCAGVQVPCKNTASANVLLPARHLHPTAAFLQGGCRKKGQAQLPGQQDIPRAEGPTQPIEKWSLLQNSPFASTILSRLGRDEGDQTLSSFGDSYQPHINQGGGSWSSLSGTAQALPRAQPPLSTTRLH